MGNLSVLLLLLFEFAALRLGVAIEANKEWSHERLQLMKVTTLEEKPHCSDTLIKRYRLSISLASGSILVVVEVQVRASVLHL